MRLIILALILTGLTGCVATTKSVNAIASKVTNEINTLKKNDAKTARILSDTTMAVSSATPSDTTLVKLSARAEDHANELQAEARKGTQLPNAKSFYEDPAFIAIASLLMGGTGVGAVARKAVNGLKQKASQLGDMSPEEARIKKQEWRIG